LLVLEHALAAFAYGVMTIYFIAGDMLSGPLPWGLMGLQSCCQPILVLLLPIAAVTDPQWSRRDFLHWTGVVAAVSTDLLSLASWWVIVNWR
jgi:hypothetical protein